MSALGVEEKLKSKVIEAQIDELETVISILVLEGTVLTIMEAIADSGLPDGEKARLLGLLTAKLRERRLKLAPPALTPDPGAAATPAKNALQKTRKKLKP